MILHFKRNQNCVIAQLKFWKLSYEQKAFLWRENERIQMISTAEIVNATEWVVFLNFSLFFVHLFCCHVYFIWKWKLILTFQTRTCDHYSVDSANVFISYSKRDATHYVHNFMWNCILATQAQSTCTTHRPRNRRICTWNERHSYWHFYGKRYVSSSLWICTMFIHNSNVSE